MRDIRVLLADEAKEICHHFYGRKGAHPCASCPIEKECHAPVNPLTLPALNKNVTKINEAAKAWKESNEATHPLYQVRRDDLDHRGTE